MALNASFSIAQTALLPNLVVAEDTSTGSDASVTQRRIFVQTATGAYLVPSGTTTDYTQWSIAEPSITLNILTTDQACTVTVQWLDVSGNVLYTSSNVFCFPEYNKQFMYYLVQLQGLKPNVVQDNNYFGNMCQFWINVEGALVAIEVGADVSASQNCLDRASYMRLNQSLFF